MPNKRKYIVRLSSVSKSFLVGKTVVPVLKNINLQVRPQEFTIIYGPSGSGKSTLLNTILGLEPPDHGKVYVQGKDISALNDDERAGFRNKTFGVVYQQSYWIKTLSVLENVALPLFLGGRDTSYANSRALHALSEVGMKEFARRSPIQLSGGQQQRVGVARALATDPVLIVADEPTGNLDTKSADDLITLFNNLITQFHRTVVMVTHDLRFLDFAHRAFEIKDGYIEGKFDKKDIKKIIQDLKTVNLQ